MQGVTPFSLLCTAVVAVLVERFAREKAYHNPTLIGLAAGAVTVLAAYLWN
jgi:hypothetical protein